MTSVNVTTQKNTVTVTEGTTNVVTVTAPSQLSFIQAGSGAVGRAITDKLKDVISAQDFGVTGDGSTDDGANIQIAIDAAANKKLYFPSGTYKITDRQITINNPIHIIGDGKSTVLQSTIADNSSVAQCFKIRSSNVTFEDISIDSRNGDADSGDVTILIQASTTAGFINDTLFKNVHITGGNTLMTSGDRIGRPCNHGVLINNTTNVRRLRIDSCHWEKLNIGFFTQNTYGNPTNGDISCRDVTVINSSFTDFGKRPFVFNSDFSTSGKTFAHDGIKVIGCHFARLIGQDLDQRCTFLGGDGVRNLTVTGCQFRDLHTEPNDGAIHVENHGDNFICTNNSFLNCAGGITFYSLSTKAIITNNIILANTRRRQKVKVATSKVSTANNTIEIEGHEYETGDPIVYDKGGKANSVDITGLSSGTTYNVIKVDEKLFKLATSYNNALAGTAINLTGTGNNSQTFGSEPSYFPEEATVATSAVSTANDTITISNHGYHTKDSILYENGGGASITGLTSGQVYYVVKIDANTFKLATTLSNAAASSPTTLDLTGAGNNAQIFSPYAKDFGSNGILLIVNSDGSADRTIVSNNIIEGFHKGINFSGDDTTHEISDNLINLCTYGLKITSLNKAFIATRNRVSNSKYFADVLANASVTLSNNICEECANVFTSTITGSRNNIIKNFKIIKTITDYVGGQTPSSSPSSFRTLMQAPTFGKGQFIARLFETATPDDECVAIADYEFAAADGTLTLSNYQRVNQGSVGLNATGSNSFRINSNNFEVSAFSAITQYLTWEISFTGNLVFTDNSTVSGTTTTVDNYGTKELFFSDAKKAEATVDGFSIDGDLAVSGNMTVSGEVTVIDTTTLRVEDKNIELGKVGSPTDITADGGGITLLGDTNHTFNWLNATDSWTSSEHIALPDNKKLKLGADNDVEIYSNGSHGFIQGKNTQNGQLHLNANNILIKNAINSKSYIRAYNGGAVELYYDNVKKAETTADGFNILSATTNVGALIASGSSISSHAYGHGANGNQNQGLTIQANESCLELISSSGGFHAGSILIRDSSNDGFGFINDPTNKELRLKSFTTSADNFFISGSGSNLSRLDDCIVIKKDGAVSLFNNGSKVAETTSRGLNVTSATNPHLLVTSDENLNEHAYQSVRNGVTIKSSEARLDLIANGNGTHAGSFLMRDNSHDGFGFVNDFTNKEFQLKSFTSSGIAFSINSTGSNVSRLDNCIVIKKDGSVSLFHDGTKKAETVSTGLDVDGNVIANNLIVANGISHEGQTNTNMAFDGTSIKFQSNGVERFSVTQFAAFITAGYKLAFTASSGENPTIKSGGTNNGDLLIESGTASMAQFKRNSAVELYHNGVKRCETTNNGVTVSGNLFTGHINAALDGNTSISLRDTGHGFGASEIKLSNGGRDLNIVAPVDIRLFPLSGENGIVIEGNGQVELYHDNVKKAETSSTGLDVTGDVKASTGILFGSDTADDNRLDDYEIGTWTPTVVSEGTIGTPQYTCTYTKIGRLVTINADIHQLSDTTSDSHILIGGLPYVPTRTNGNWQAVCQGERYGFKDIIVAYLLYTGGAWRIGFRYGVPLNHFSYVKHSNISDDGTDNNLRFTLTYELAT